MPVRTLVLFLASLACANRDQHGELSVEKRQHSQYLTESSPMRSLASLFLCFNSAPGWQRDGKVIEPSSTLAPTLMRYRRHAAVNAMAEKEKENSDPLPWFLNGGKIAEKLGDFFFGEDPEDTVFGLKRAMKGTDSYADMEKATKTEFADPVEGDEGEVKLIRPLLKMTILEKMQLKCVYDANKDGWSAEDFHRCVDKTGPCVVIGKTQAGAIVGGYACVGFIGLGEERNSISAFLFSWPDGDTSKPGIKCRILEFGDASTVDFRNTGPRFGRNGFSMTMQKGNEHVAQSKLGLDYEVMPDKRRSIFAREEGNAAYLTELRTYVGCFEEEGRPVPYATPLFYQR